MTNSIIHGLAELRQSIVDHDGAKATVAKSTFVAHNWSMIVAMDQLAHADYTAGNYRSALAKLQVLTELLPENTGMLLRRARAELRNNIPHVLEKLVDSKDRITNDHELFDLIDILIGEGRSDLAQWLLERCSGDARYSVGIMAASKARVLASQGRISEGLRELADIDPGHSSLLVERVRYGLTDSNLDFEQAGKLSRNAAVRWGEEHDLRFALTNLGYIFDFAGALSLLEEFARVFPTTAVPIPQLVEEWRSAREAAAAAIQELGPVEAVPRPAVFAALSNAGATASRILWGKQALVALLKSGSMAEADYLQFAWFLPNWEQAAVRNRVLAAALASCPHSPAVRRGWLYYLIATRAYGDAAAFCESLLTDQIDADTLFFLISLLRLQQLRIVPSFMSEKLFEQLRGTALKAVEGMDTGFKFFLQDHFVALGWRPPSWGTGQLPTYDNAEERGTRRLFAVTTGRLNRVTTNTRPSILPESRPVVAISGQVRGFAKAWASINLLFRKPMAAPVVMSVWDKSTNATGRHAGRLERALPPDLVLRLRPEERYTDSFAAAFPQTFKLLFGVTKVDASALREIVEADTSDILELETESEEVLQELLHPHISPNMLKMYYKLARLEALIREREWRGGKTFSHVLWIRPDCEIVQLDKGDLIACLARSDVAWSSFITETSFGDYAMILPRPAFAALASIFPRVCLAGDTRLLPWRPNRSAGPRPAGILDGFGGPDVIFDVLLGAGYLPLAGIPRMIVNLRAGTVDEDTIRATFSEEVERKRSFPRPS